jgi:hypothetical protein
LGARHDSLNAAVQTYLLEIAPLESLSLWSWMEVIPLTTILSRHGQTLRTLQLHERETTANHGRQLRKLLTFEDLEAIRTGCPNLRDLTIDIDRYTEKLDPQVELDHYADKLRILASMNLDKLQIYYDLGIARLDRSRNWVQDEIPHDEDSSSPASPPQPDRKRVKRSRGPQFLNPSTYQDIEPFVKELWRTIFGGRPNSTSRALDVKFGEWERKMGIGYPARWVLKEGEKKTYWVVRPDERDDQPGECVVTRHGGGVNGERPA